MSIERLSGGLSPADGADPRTFPEIFNGFADEFEGKNIPAFGTAAPSDGDALVYNDAEGVYEPGEGGAGSLEDLTDTDITSPSNENVLIYDGTNWVNAGLQANSDLFLQNDVTVTVGATGDYSTLQEAFDDLAPLNPGPYLIEVKIQSGTTINAGLELVGGDYRQFTITSEDATVQLGSGITSGLDPLIRLSACFGPTIEVFFDGTNHSGQGFSVLNGSSIVIAPNCGIEDMGWTALNLQSSEATVRDAILRNSQGQDNVRLNATSSADLLRTDATGAFRFGIQVSASVADGRLADFRKTPGVDDPDDIRVKDGGLIAIRNADGGTSVTVNTVTSDGIIFQ